MFVIYISVCRDRPGSAPKPAGSSSFQAACRRAPAARTPRALPGAARLSVPGRTAAARAGVPSAALPPCGLGGLHGVHPAACRASAAAARLRPAPDRAALPAPPAERLPARPPPHFASARPPLRSAAPPLCRPPLPCPDSPPLPPAAPSGNTKRRCWGRGCPDSPPLPPAAPLPGLAATSPPVAGGRPLPRFSLSAPRRRRLPEAVPRPSSSCCCKAPVRWIRA